MIEIRKLSIDDSYDIYNFLQELPKEENGFNNRVNGMSFLEFKEWLLKKYDEEIQEGLVDGWRVPSTTYYLIVDGKPAGIGNIRHFLTDALRIEGGHIGYAVSPNYRNKGYGKEFLKLMLIEAKKLGISKVLVTAYIDNLASQKVAIANGGVITDRDEKRVRIWIDN